MTRAVARIGALLLALPLALAPAVAPAAAPATGAPRTGVAAAPAAPAPLQVRIDVLTPLLPEPGGTLTVKGTVANAGAEPVDAVQVRLRLSPGPLTGRSQIAGVVNATSDEIGERVPGTREPVTDRLAPGATTPFTINVPVDDLGLGRDGVYVVGVEAVGDDETGASVRLGLTRTFLPWVPDPEAVEPSRLVTLWPVTAPPAVDDEGVLLDEDLPRSVAVGGRLRTALDVGARFGSTVSWIADPALLEAVADMSDGYRVRAPGGEVTPGEDPESAAAWLAAARSTLAGADLLAMPYADPDAVALVRGRLDRDVLRATTTAAESTGLVLGRTVPGVLAWPAGLTVDEPTLSVLRDAGVRGVLLSDEALPADPPTSFTPTGSAALPAVGGATRAVVADTGMSAAYRMPGTSPSEVVLARQRLAAELTMAALELPGTPRTFVAAPAVRWSPAPALAAALLETSRSLPWIRPAPLSGLLTAPPSDVPRAGPRYGDAARAAELPESYVSRLAASERGLRALGEIAVDPEPLTAAPAAALQRAGSSAWREDPATGARLLGLTAAGIGADVGRVRIVSRGTVSFSGGSGVVPVTIANDLDGRVVVGLRVTGDPAVRVAAEPVAPVTIEPGRKASVDVRLRVSGTGPVPVTLQLTTPDGTPFGLPATIEVGSTASAQAAAWVVGGAFALLLALVAVNTVRRIRVARAGPPDDPDDTDTTGDPDDPDGSGPGPAPGIRLLPGRGSTSPPTDGGSMAP